MATMTFAGARTRSFVAASANDAIVRSAYQVGKSPVLPVFAASLGAEDVLLGTIVSVSVVTGLALKPFAGAIADRVGRRRLLLIAAAVFTFVPFLYAFVSTPGELCAVRLTHGLATAIQGPASMAYVASLSKRRVGERFGWFGIARSLGYIVGPALGGWLLLTAPPAEIYPIVGIISGVAFIPALLCDEPPRPKRAAPLHVQVSRAMREGAMDRRLWLCGGAEGVMYVALYALKTFLPLSAALFGTSLLWIGLCFSAQEVVTILGKPIAGRTADRIGTLHASIIGMGLIASALMLITLYAALPGLLLAAVLLGAGQALITTSLSALVASILPDDALGAGMGLVGAVRNGGKIMGPVVGGALVAGSDLFVAMRVIAALMTVTGLTVIWRWSRRPLSV